MILCLTTTFAAFCSDADTICFTRKEVVKIAEDKQKAEDKIAELSHTIVLLNQRDSLATRALIRYAALAEDLKDLSDVQNDIISDYAVMLKKKKRRTFGIGIPVTVAAAGAFTYILLK